MKKMLLLSLVLHLVVLAFLKWQEDKATQAYWEEQARLAPAQISLPTRVIEDREWRRIVESAPASGLSVQDRSQKTRFLGERTQRVERETRASGFGSVEASQDSVKEKPRAPSTPIKDHLTNLASLWKLPIEGMVQESPESDAKDLAHGNLDPLDPSIAVGAQTLLNTDEYVYASFFNRVKREVAPRWEPAVRNFMQQTLSLVDGVYTTRYAFFLNSEGRLENMELLMASGSIELDALAAEALRRVAVFPNPPQALKNEEGLYRVELGFMLHFSKSRFKTDYLPDPRFRRVPR
jgi:TonB family protein